MILTCPQCETRYTLPASALVPDGKRVRCSQCKDTWFQLPDPEELVEKKNIEIDFADVPEAVKPEDKPPGKSEARLLYQTPRVTKQAKALPASGGYVVAVCTFVLIFAGLYMMREGVAHAWPPAALLYEKLGVPVTVGPHGLDFFDVTVKAAPADGNDGEFINIAGRIVNATPEPQAIPYVGAILRDSSGKALQASVIEPAPRFIPPGEGANFSASYHMKEKGTDNVRLRVLSGDGADFIKTAAEDAGNTPVPAPDGQTPPRVAAEGGGSPAHVSVRPHQESSH